MAGIIQEKDRNTIPRWRNFNHAQTLPEFHAILSARKSSTVGQESLRILVNDWRKHRTIGHATDVLGAALINEQLQEVTDAIEFLVARNENASPFIREFAEQCKLLLENNPHIPTQRIINRQLLQEQVRRLKKHLHNFPHNPIQWVDLSRAYANLGQGKQAEHCMSIATHLAPNNRFVLRSAARLWVHFDHSDRAHHILVRSERTPHDPWLLAAEIAVGTAAGAAPKYMKHALRTLDSGKFPPDHISELASAVATVEWKNNPGSPGRKFRKLLRQSLVQPTENSIAQAVWISGKQNLIDLDENHLQRSDAHEAQARNSFFKEEWCQVVKHCKEWQKDEPFSKRPARLGAYIASVVLEEFKEANEIASTALEANPNDPNLLNSSAYALISLGKYKEAKRKLDLISNTNNIEHMVLKAATTGLLSYRQKNAQEGRALYNRAHSLAQKISKDHRTLPANVAAFHALEEYHHLQPPDRSQLITGTIQNLKRFRDPFCEILIRKLDALENSASSLLMQPT